MRHQSINTKGEQDAWRRFGCIPNLTASDIVDQLAELTGNHLRILQTIVNEYQSEPVQPCMVAQKTRLSPVSVGIYVRTLASLALVEFGQLPGQRNKRFYVPTKLGVDLIHSKLIERVWELTKKE